MKKWFRYMAVLSAVALLAAACAEEEPGPGAADGDEVTEKLDVTVYAQGAITGDFNYLVVPGVNAAKLRAQELSDDPDFPATITVEDADTQGDPEQAPPVVETAVSDPNTVAVIGPAFSGESEASGDTYNEAGIPFVTQAATNPGLSDQNWEYWYRTIANDDDQGTPTAQWMAQQGVQSAFVVHDVSTYGQGLAEVVRDVLGEEGVEVAGFEGIEATEDYSALISDIEASGADAMYYGGYDAQTGLIVAQARDAGLDIPVYSGDGSVSTTLLDLAGDAATDIFLSCPCNLEGSTEFLSKYEAEFGETGVPIYAAEGYDAMSVVGEGIAAAIEGGAEDPTAIREGIREYLDGLTEDAPFEGVAKTIAFDPETHELAAENRTDLIFFYEVQPGEISLLGSATEVLG
jgi:branched-chain amino acid transport system substrate-binding protein